jgi:branched-chain amino acid transport system ATP-binding protein
MAALVEVENPGAFYGATEALHALIFSLEEGGITTLLGANGAGKTKGLRAISRLVRFVLGPATDIKQDTAVRRSYLGY